jgi:hypothetical protein
MRRRISFALMSFVLFMLHTAYCQSGATLPSTSTTEDYAKVERSIAVDGTRPNDPLQIVGFKVDGKTVSPVANFMVEGRITRPGASFQATDEAWLRTSSVVVKNVSKRTVMGIWMTLFFPEINDGNATVTDHIQIGNVAFSEMYTISGGRLHDTDNPPFLLSPGQTAEIPIGTNYVNTKALREKTSPTTIPTICLIRFSAVYFVDGMKWAPGVFARPDTDHPGQFIHIQPSEFYDYTSGTAHQAQK